jgi:hypothetical protein|tara:strand:+ start:207 stop:641 length:435 start_codon:yes stop_codon:yes gene_type:complete
MNNLGTSKFSANKDQLKNIKRQGGWTFWSLLFALLTVLFFAYVGMQLVPIFTENKNVENAMQLAIDNVDPRKATRKQIVRKLQDQLYLDGSHYLLDYKTDLKVSRTRKKFIIETHYRREIPLFFNVGVYANFDNVVEKTLVVSN